MNTERAELAEEINRLLRQGEVDQAGVLFTRHSFTVEELNSYP